MTDDSSLTRRQRQGLIALAVVCIVLVPVGLTAAQSGVQTLDGFESGNLNNWTRIGSSDTADGEILIEDQIVSEGDFAMEINDSVGSGAGYTGAAYDGFPNADYSSIATQWNYQGGADSWMTPTGNNGQLFILEYNEIDDTWALQGTQEELDVSLIDGYHEVIVTFDYQNEQSTLYTVQNNEIQGQDTFNWTGGSGSTEITGLSYNTNSGQFYVDAVQLDAAPPGDLSIGVNNYMRPGMSQHYTIEHTPAGSNMTDDVTENATLTSSDNETLTVYETNTTVVATDNRSALPDTVTLTAEYQDFSETKNITIAKPTVENLHLLPTWWKVNATVGDGMMLWLIVATLAAVVATRAARSFAGVGAYTMIMVSGWMAGPVSDGVMVATIFTALFLGLNLAANVDTSVRGTG